jgi:RNA polymerase sigma-70 factor (ECF subfamily)
MPSELSQLPHPAFASLLARAARGDAEALGCLYDLHADRLFALAFRLTGSCDDADDVLQDVFTGLPEALQRYDERGTFAVWLSRVTARCALMRMRADRRRRAAAHREHAEISRAVPIAADTLATRLALEDALGSRSETSRVIFVLKEIEGYSHAEIASLLGISRRASEVRLFRAMPGAEFWTRATPAWCCVRRLAR